MSFIYHHVGLVRVIDGDTVALEIAPKKGGSRWHPHGEMNPAYKGGLVADKAWFVARYVAEKKSLREVAKLAECALRTVARWAKIHGVETRTSKEGINLAPKRGPDNHQWKGGPPTCSVCGTRISWRMKKCHSCYVATLSGEGNPNYKGLGKKGIEEKYRAANPAKFRAKTTKRRAKKLNATPVWADQVLIDEIYNLAHMRTVSTGFMWHVDHIVPLQSKLVCGLHVEHNLQVIPGATNLRKGNRHAI